MRVRVHFAQLLLVISTLALAASVALAQTPPNAPVITEPPFDGHIANPADTHMETMPMSDPDPGATHTCTDWEIWTITPSERVWITACIGGVERLHTHLGDGTFENSHAGRLELFPNTDYALLVRHQDEDGMWSPYAQRLFSTAGLSEVFPMELDDVSTTPTPEWVDANGGELFLPGGGVPASIEVESGAGDLLLRLEGVDGTQNSVVNPGALSAHVAVRVVVQAGSSALLTPVSEIHFTDDTGRDLDVYLPSLALDPSEAGYFWISSNGSSYYGDSGQTEPDFTTLAQGAPVPWDVRMAGYQVEVFATGFQLPVHLAFLPAPGSNAGDPLLYVTELYGQVKVVTRDGSVGDYATNLLNFDPGGNFPGSGEQGVGGVCVDPVTGDVFAAMLYDASPPTGPHYPKVVRFTSNDGGFTAASQTTILDMVGETQGQSHFISNLSIGPDGKLYVHMGDGFDASRALNLDSYRGKILRVNLDGTAPTDNPFYNAGNGINARDYVFAYGFRNPFGGDWRLSDQALYEVENGPATNDRLARVDRGASYGWNGGVNSMTTRAIYNWDPAHAPVDIAFIQTPIFDGSGFPDQKLDRAYVTESGPTWASGPQAQGKRVVEFEIDSGGELVSGPNTLVEYTGTGKATASGIAAGPDGLYFADLYKDQGYQTPIDRGANILRIEFIGTADFAADFRNGGPPLTVHFTDLSSVPGAFAWNWDFGDGETSTLQNPEHVYITAGVYDVRLEVSGDNGIAIEQKGAYVIVGDNPIGLRGDYFAGREFDSQVLSRIDPTVNFDWGEGSPDPLVPVDLFSARWTGRVRADFTETYTFFVIVDDGVRLRVNGNLIINQWIDQAPTQHAGTIALQAGQLYDIEMEYYENGGGAVARLEWQSPSRPRQSIPTTHLYPNNTTDVDPLDVWASSPHLAISSNPITQATGIRFASSRNGILSVGVFDAAGRRVRSLFSGFGGAGQEHLVEFDPAGLAAGTYFVRAADEAGVASARVVVIR